jgi:hypothetical protein
MGSLRRFTAHKCHQSRRWRRDADGRADTGRHSTPGVDHEYASGHETNLYECVADRRR